MKYTMSGSAQVRSRFFSPGEMQELNCCYLWFHNQVTSRYLCWHSCCERSQFRARCKSSGSPEKQVSQLFISCQVLGFRTGMRSVCKGCWGAEGECSLVFLTRWDGLRGGIGGFFSPSSFYFFRPASNLTNRAMEHRSGRSLMFCINT